MNRERKESKKMTDAEWRSIVEIAVKDEERNRLLEQMSLLISRFEREDVTFADVDKFHTLKIKILEREWQILVESRKLRRSR